MRGGADVYWKEQGSWVEVKTRNVLPHQVGKSWVRVDLRRSWGRNDYYMLMIAAGRRLQRAYLIPSPELEEHLGSKRSFSIPPDRVGWKFEDRLVWESPGSPAATVATALDHSA
jgi:hypothetical protein